MISCKEYSDITRELLKEDITELYDEPTLAVVQLGDDAASNSYIRSKKKACLDVGINLKHIHYSDEECKRMSESELIKLIRKLNKDNNIHGIIVQLPIPEKYHVEKIQKAIIPTKDVDGFRKDSYFKPCTPKGIMDWLCFNNIKLSGKNVTVIGRSDIVGKPLVKLLIEEGATVTCCNSKTKNIKEFTRNSDIVIVSVGVPNCFDECYFTDNQIIIDVGINRDEDGKLCGDVNRVRTYKNTYYTPVPGGVGLLTVTSLLENTYYAYKFKDLYKERIKNEKENFYN